MTTLRPSAGAGLALRAAILALTLATGWIHLTLGGPLFTLNAAGYAVAAAAMVAPLALAARFRWLVRLGLAGYAATAIVAWYMTGPRYEVAYLAKGIEIALIALLLVEVRAYDGSLVARLRGTARPFPRA